MAPSISIIPGGKCFVEVTLNVALGIKGKVPPKAAGPTSKFGSEFPVNLR